MRRSRTLICWPKTLRRKKLPSTRTGETKKIYMPRDRFKAFSQGSVAVSPPLSHFTQTRYFLISFFNLWMVVRAPSLLHHLQLLFEAHDKDQSGELEWGEFWAILTDLDLGLTDENIGEWQAFADADQSGTVGALSPPPPPPPPPPPAPPPLALFFE